MEIRVGASAFKRISELAKARNEKESTLRISVDSGGCSGFSYRYEFVDGSEEGDYVIACGDGIAIAIDETSQKYLDGSSFEFIEELGKSYFEIQNPNSKSKCGCGNSFSID